MAHRMTPLTGTLHRLRRGRSLVGVAIDTERLADIEHGRAVPSLDELRRIARVLDLDLIDWRDLERARHRALLAALHRQRRRAS